MFTIKVFSANQKSKFPAEFTNDLLFDYDYRGVDDLKYFNPSFDKDGETLFFILIDEEQEMVCGNIAFGVMDKERFKSYKSSNWFEGIFIHDDYKGKGLSKKLLQYFFDFCSQHGIDSVLLSSYTDLGLERVKKNVSLYSEQYPEIKVFSNE